MVTSREPTDDHSCDRICKTGDGGHAKSFATDVLSHSTPPHQLVVSTRNNGERKKKQSTRSSRSYQRCTRTLFASVLAAYFSSTTFAHTQINDILPKVSRETTTDQSYTKKSSNIIIKGQQQMGTKKANQNFLRQESDVKDTLNDYLRFITTTTDQKEDYGSAYEVHDITTQKINKKQEKGTIVNHIAQRQLSENDGEYSGSDATISVRASKESRGVLKNNHNDVVPRSAVSIHTRMNKADEDDNSSIIRNILSSSHGNGQKRYLTQLPDLIWPDDFQFNAYGSTPDWNCLLVNDNTAGWYDNHFCWRKGKKDPEIIYRYWGEIENMRCTSLYDPTMPDWIDNFLCVPYASPFVFNFQYNGNIAGKSCIKWYEPASSSSIDNYLCCDQGCPPRGDIPLYNQDPLTDDGIYGEGTIASIQCPYNTFWRKAGEITCAGRPAAWDKDREDACELDVVPESAFRLLPSTFDKCPPSMFLSKEDCTDAGLSVGGKLRDGQLNEGSWSHLPFGCSIERHDLTIHYNSCIEGIDDDEGTDCHAQNNGVYEPVCVGSFTLMTSLSGIGCPLSRNVSEEDCYAAGLSVGGQFGSVDVGSWDYLPSGCMLSHDLTILFNLNNNGKNDGHRRSVCHSQLFFTIDGMSQCPMESSVSKEQCAVAGLSVGGRLQRSELMVEAYDDKPSGCFFSKGDNIIRFNTNPVGQKGDNYTSICNEFQSEDYVLLPPKSESSCPSSINIKKKDCEDAGLAVGGLLSLDQDIIERNWTDRPSGCFFGPEIYYNANPHSSDSPSSLPSLLPTTAPSASPSDDFSFSPSGDPSSGPNTIPSTLPSGLPSDRPSSGQSSVPSSLLSLLPTTLPSSIPTTSPSVSPSDDLSFSPSGDPSSGPSTIPSTLPSGLPSDHPSSDPSSYVGYAGNVALGKLTDQSNTMQGSNSDDSQKAVDGNTSGYWNDGSVTHTNPSQGSNPWWSVDLLDSYRIKSIKVFNRIDCCSDRLNDFKLTIYNGGSEEYVYNHNGIASYETIINVPLNVIGDGVKISLSGDNRILSLAEVEVEAKYLQRQLSEVEVVAKYPQYQVAEVDMEVKYPLYSICHKLTGVVEVPSDKQKCPPDKAVNQNDCISAGLSVGGEHIGGDALSIVDSWDDRPSGCFIENVGFKMMFFNTNASPTENSSNEVVSLLCQWECTQQFTKQHLPSLGCQCIDGYVSEETGEQVLTDDFDICTSALLSFFIRTTSSTITYTSTVVTEMKDLKFTQRAPANDIVIDITEKFSTSFISDANGDTEYSYTFSALEPGHRYNIQFSYVEANGEEKHMKFPAVTSCSACEGDSDKTGPPSNLKIVQDSGHVMFSFEDCSLCEEAYSFTRKSYEEGNNKPVSFTRDYFFISMQASGAEISPLTEASDNLLKSKLTVGKNYTYCVRAVHPVLYMDHPYDHEDVGRTLLSSSDTCSHHRIQWEASVHGKITTEPNAGLLPIKNVHIEYSLLQEDEVTLIECNGCNGTALTTEGGAFDITFNVDHEILYEKNTHEVPIKVTLKKITRGNNGTSIEHMFLCNEGEDDCSGDIGIIIYLSHLQFKEPLHVYDDTSVPFSGRITIKDTSYPGAQGGCAISNAEVCLIHERNVGGVMKTNETLVCVVTDPEGTYSAPVIIGSRVDYIDIMYHNHTFEPSSDSNFEKGTVIKAENYYHAMNFIDVEKARMMVDIVGGLCNENIGISTIEIRIAGCDWEGTKEIQAGTRGIYNNVPAHLVDVQVVEITDTLTNERYDHIWAFFQGDRPLVRSIDLRSTGSAAASIEEERESLNSNSTTGLQSKENIKQEEKKNLESIEKEEEEELELVRFQFDGNLKMEISVSPDSLQCSNYTLDEFDSLHVLDYMKYFLIRVDLKYEIIEDKVYCDILDSELQLRVENQVGIDQNEGFEDFYNSISDDQTKDALLKCNNGCLYEIGHEEDAEGNPISGANVTDWFATGRPNIAAPYTKSMIFTIQGGRGDITHKADFVIEGYYSKGPGRSFALPTHKPIMILRDPPGGLSYATYENIITTMKLETSSTSTSIHNTFGIDLKTVVSLDSDLCSGGGIGAIVLGCQKIAESDQKLQVVGLEQGLGGTVQMSDKTKSNQFSTTWSYETSSDPWIAGPLSDIFVVPNLNIMYREVYVVKWDNSTCFISTEDNGNLPITTTFNIEDTENEPALAFFSRYHVNNVKVPELQTAISNKKNLKSDCNCSDDKTDVVMDVACTYFEVDGTEKMIKCSEIEYVIESLQAGINGWDTALEDEKEIFELNTKDMSKTINNWFGDFGQKDMNEGDPVSIRDQNSGLAPPSLGKEALDNGLFNVEDDEEPMKRIQFSGGGNLFSMSMDKEKVWDEVALSCWEGCNTESESDIKGPGLDEASFEVFGVGQEMQLLPLNFNIHVLHESTRERSDTQSTSIGFVLGDDDAGDEFVVDFFYDDKYGTVIFKTVGGQSKCPNEINTAAVEDPRLRIKSRPSQYIFPEEHMVFELEMNNVGVGSSYFVLYVEDLDNDSGLVISLDGSTLVSERGSSSEMSIDPKSYTKTLIVERGPLSYEYAAIDIFIKSACEYDSSISLDDSKFDVAKLYNFQDDDEGMNLIKFVEPCPKVEWAGLLNRDRHFVVNTISEDPDNLQVVVFNPSHAQNKFHNMTSNRLENIFLYYREVGDLHWSKARTEITNNDGSADSLIIDFAAEYSYKEESDYGYSSLKWSLANKVPEGTYEIRIDAECDKVGGPADMDLYSTPILTGVIDLTPPEQYGEALPLRDSVLIGEEISVVFTEEVRCESFDLQVAIDSVAGFQLDRNDRSIQIACDSRKIGFQIDPTQINVEDLIGMRFTVEIGQISTADVESKSNIFDMNGNPIKFNVKFEKVFADIDLEQASTLFTVTLDNMNNCANTDSDVCSSEIRDVITSLLNLSLSDRNRIEVNNVSQLSGSTVSAKIKILPVDNGESGRMLRYSETSGIRSSSKHSVGLFRELQSTVDEVTKSRTLISKFDYIVANINNMKILPTDSDVTLVTTDPEMMDKEQTLYRYASLNGNVGGSQTITNELARQVIDEEIVMRERKIVAEIESRSKSREEALISEIENKSKAREEAMMRKIERVGELLLKFEVGALALAGVSIALSVYLLFRRF